MADAGRPVLIHFLAIVKYDHMPDYPVQFMAKGRMYSAPNGRVELKYTESQPDEATGEIISSDITMTLGNDDVTMVRIGEFSNTMAFSRNQRYEGVYTTPYGEFNLSVFTRELRMKKEPGRGSVHLNYQLSIQGNVSSSHELHLEYYDETIAE